MSRWEQIDTAPIPGNAGVLRLYKRDGDFAIRIAGGQGDLMNSRTHDSEDALGQLGCTAAGKRPHAKVLVGGLGMGFTLAAALKCLAPDARVIVAELVPDVIRWNQGLVGNCAGNPLNDQRVSMETVDVRELIGNAKAAFDAILLDVDNGPEGLTHPHNDHLYSLQGLARAYTALRPGGTLAVWSATPAPRFAARLPKVGFLVDERRIRAHRGKGSRHVIWLATRR
ncbi:MAG: hypothetical protein O3A63_01215 [Proteobacteria bacterium]|nr:hypothetical protein [Pseudomonadota bacterium]